MEPSIANNRSLPSPVSKPVCLLESHSMKSRVYPRSRRILSVLRPVILIGFLGLTLPGCGDKADSVATTDVPDSQPESIPSVPPTQGTAQEVLGRMIQTYKNVGSYGDVAVVRVSGTQNGERQEMNFKCAVVIQRPNKIRMEIDLGTLLSDGVNIYGFSQELPGQVLQIPAPPELSIKSAYQDSLLAKSMMQSPTQAFSWVPLQLILLLADDPMKTLTLDSQVNLLEPRMIELSPCDRVELVTGNGPGVLWIDQATSVLRRFEVPADALRREAETQQFLNPSLVVEYGDVQLNPVIPPEVFTFRLPDGMSSVDALTMPLLQVLGQPCPDFEFTDMEGNTTALSSLRDKVVVMLLWTSKILPCRSALQAAAKAYADVENPDDVVVMAVCLEGENVQNASLQTVFKDWGVELPIYRDLQQNVAKHYGISTAPVTIVVGKKGNVQSLQAGPLENMDVLLAMVIERLQAGEDVYRSAFAQFENERAAFAMMVDQCVTDDIYCFRPMIPRTEVKPRTEPAKLKMTKLWSCDQLKHPGNITVLPAADGVPRIIVVDESKSAAELGTDGTVVANRALDLQRKGESQRKDVVTMFSTAVAGDGKRYFLGAAHGVENVFLFDESLDTLLAYPESQHPGIGDAKLVDLDGDGVLEMVLAYGGAAGVHAVDLQGNRLWRNNSVLETFCVATLSPDDGGRRNILAMNGGVGGGTLVELDSQGKRLGEISVLNHSVGWVAADDLDGDGTSEVCVLAVALGPDAQPVLDTIDALGIDATGKVLWSHSLVRGVHRQFIEPVITGNVLPTGPKQWLFAAADGTVTVIAADGQLVDSFAYGAELAGLATAQWDGKPVLLVSTPEVVEAWQIEAPAN